VRRTYDGRVTAEQKPAGTALAPDTSAPRPAAVDGPRRVLLAAPRGYCAGVDRAVVAVEKALEHYGPPVYVRKQIVHNKHVVHTLEGRGAVFVDETDEVPEGALVIFSAHGVSPVVHEQAALRGLRTIDATCPLVTKVHKEAVRFASDDFDILLIGHTGHEEVEGTAGEAPRHIQVVNGPEQADRVVVRDPSRVVWLSQTTLSVDETMETVRRLRARFPLLQDPPSDDICYATQNRQVAVKKIAAQADLVIVVGSSNSSNSVRLVEVALEHGAGAAHRVDNAAEISLQWLDGVATVGVTSGASVPEVLVQEVLALLAEQGFGAAEEVVTAEEDLLFSLPRELHRDLKAAGSHG
jgi:4-hydroxy-3-methylbut-2-enyl diphosphate reductase